MLLTLLICGILTVVCSVGASPPAGAIANGGYDSTQPGFDACPLPSTAAMSTWWTYSPYWWYSVYIGGSNALCPPGNISSWLNTVNDAELRWNFEYTWVGPQPPCSTYTNRFSSDQATAYSQGEAEAQSALSQLATDGVANSAQGTPVIYDLESAGNGTCQAAINSFIQGWIYWLNLAPAQVPGVYGSVCGSNLAALASLSPPPAFIWGALYDGTRTRRTYTGLLTTAACPAPTGLTSSGSNSTTRT